MFRTETDDNMHHGLRPFLSASMEKEEDGSQDIGWYFLERDQCVRAADE